MRADWEVEYAQAGDVSVAYATVGKEGPDLVLVMGFASHLDVLWELPEMARFLEGLASFSRLIMFDKRGTGLSDRSVGIPTLEERMDDIRAVLDAVGSERAVLAGVSEGAPTCLLFAATYPERTVSVVSMGGMARSTEGPDYPWAAPAEAVIEGTSELITPDFYSGLDLEYWAPSVADIDSHRKWLARYRRSSVSPDGMFAIFMMFLDIDVRHVLPALQVPVLVLHRRGDRVVNRRAGEWMASQIDGATYVELAGQDHFPWYGDTATLLDEIREFVTGERAAPDPDRVLATVLFTDIAGSTERAAELGDRSWRELLDRHDEICRAEVERHRGRVIKSTGDGMLATFDGPARAIRAAQQIRSTLRGLGLSVRCGLHTGEIELRGDDVSGIAVVLAERVSGLAEGGEVLVSSTVKDLVAGSGLRFEAEREEELRGVPGTWRLYRVAG